MAGHTTFLLLLLVSALSLSSGQIITELHTLTCDASDAGMGIFGTVDVEIVTAGFTSCTIHELNGEGNDFQPGDINVFEGAELQECRGFSVPDHDIGLLKITHDGSDAWCPEWIRVVYDDATFSQCDDGQFIDGGESHELHCTKPGEISAKSEEK